MNLTKQLKPWLRAEVTTACLEIGKKLKSSSEKQIKEIQAKFESLNNQF